MVYETRYCMNIFLSHFLYLFGISVAILFSGLAVPVPRISPWRQAVVPPPAVSGAWEAVEVLFFFKIATGIELALYGGLVVWNINFIFHNIWDNPSH